MSGPAKSNRAPRVRLADVAAHAKVSTAAVSITLNDRPGVSDAVRERIRASVLELGYRSDRLAASLRTGRTDTLGLIVRNIANPHYAEMISVVEEHCAAAGLSVLVASSGFDPARERTAVHDLLDRGVDILAVTPVGPVSDADRWGPLDDLPLILIDADGGGNLAPNPSVWTRSFDVQAGVTVAVGHLAELGHRRIAMITLTDHPDESKVGAFENEARRLGLDPATIVAAVPTVAATYDAILPVLERARGDRPTAIVFGSDDTALAGYMAAAELGLRIPEDLSVVGAEGMRTSAFLNPSLTTLDQHPVRMGESLGRLIADIRQGHSNEPRDVRLDVDLRVGRSTAAPALT